MIFPQNRSKVARARPQNRNEKARFWRLQGNWAAHALVSYDRILAKRSFILPIPGSGFDGVKYLRSLLELSRDGVREAHLGSWLESLVEYHRQSRCFSTLYVMP